MRRKILLLCNANAGIGTNNKNFFEIVQCLSENGCEVTVYPIIPSSGLTSESIIAEGWQNYDAIACCGGDGTLNHVINTLAKNNIDLPIGYIPFGSTNDFARTAYRKDRVSVRDVCRYIIVGRSKPYDIGCLNGEYFNYVACFGAFTKVSYTTPRDLKSTLGYGAYVLNTIAAFPEDINFVRHVRLIYDGNEEEGDYFSGFVSNSISVAGMKLDAIGSSEIDDGVFELSLVRHPTNVIEAADLGSVLMGAVNDKALFHRQVKHLEMFFDEDTLWTMDGEDAKAYRHVTIDVVPKKIRIFTDM